MDESDELSLELPDNDDLGLTDEFDEEPDFFEQDGPGLFGDPEEEDEPEPAPKASAPATPAPSPAAAATAPVAPEVPEPPLALYRRYRPDTFGDMIGQEHVTEPLKRALINNRVNHAYLFSGPRGCGKTTSARILARALNCEQGPTPDPCGECQSCRDLARGGTGSIDVIEIDAASHGGVDDARDLRERAFFSPVNSRYKIYIVDEAHMVTTAGFNAMLKLVEEPPPHVKFIFATTEPDKVIGTIRSRTHHYPFRLVPPKVLSGYLATLCDAEGVKVDPTVLPLVVRAGGGSVRDSLSVLDQLLGGSGENGVTYHQAAGLLGYTPDALLDEIMDAFAAGDARGVFAAVDKVIEVGQDPRRFGEDLLHRLRDLVIVAAVPEAVDNGLIDVSADQAERLKTQAAGMGPGELTRAAEVMAQGLTDMRGTTAPRLHLELMCSRILLPGADVDERGVHARLERLERRIAAGGVPVSHTEGPAPEPERVQWKPEETAPTSTAVPAAAPAADSPASAPSSPVTAAAPEPLRQRPAQRETEPEAAAEKPLAPVVPISKTEAPHDPTVVDAARVRAAWPQILEEVLSRRRFSWILLSQNAQVVDVRDGVLTLGMSNSGARDSFSNRGTPDILRDSIIEIIGADLKIVAVVSGEATPHQGQRSGGEQPAPTQRPASPVSPVPVQHDEPYEPDEPEPDAPEPAIAEPTDSAKQDEERAANAALRAQAKAQIRSTQKSDSPASADEHEDVSDADDEIVDDSVESAADLITRQLGGEIIHEE